MLLKNEHLFLAWFYFLDHVSCLYFTAHRHKIHPPTGIFEHGGPRAARVTDTPHPTPANDICIISLVFFEVVPGQGQSFLEKTTNDFMVFGEDQFFGKKI